jgi:hypothetical protein
MNTEERVSQWDQFGKSRRSTGQIIMEQAEVMKGVVDAPPESQGSLWHKASCMWEWQQPWTVIHQEFDAIVSPTSSFETVESQQECRPGAAINGVARRLSWQRCRSMIHPRMVLHIDQLVLPWSIYLTEEGSLRKMLSPGSTGQNKTCKQDAADSVQTGGGTLCSADKVVDKNIDCCELVTMGVVQVGVMKQGHGQWRRQIVTRNIMSWYRCVILPGKQKRLRLTGR